MTVDRDALNGDLDPGVSLANHRRVIRIWREHGVLSFSGTWLQDCIVSLPVKQKKLWQLALKEQRTTKMKGDALHLIYDSEGLHLIDPDLRLALVDDTRGEILGIPSDLFCTTLTHPLLELCCFQCADEAEIICLARQSGSREVKAGDNVAKVWRDRFAPLVKYGKGKTLVVVDRFAVANHVDRPSDCGFRRLLSEVEEQSRQLNVRLFSSYGHTERPSDIQQAIGALVTSVRSGSGGLQQVELVLARRQFMGLAHDRYVRMTNSVCDIGRGLDILSGSNVSHDSTFAFTSELTVKRQREMQLKGGTGSVTCVY